MPKSTHRHQRNGLMPFSFAIGVNLAFKISNPCSGKVKTGAKIAGLDGSGTTWLGFKLGSILAKSVWVSPRALLKYMTR